MAMGSEMLYLSVPRKVTDNTGLCFVIVKKLRQSGEVLDVC